MTICIDTFCFTFSSRLGVYPDTIKTCDDFNDNFDVLEQQDSDLSM